MRRILALVLILFFMASCAHTPRGGDLRQSRDSAYKIKVTLTLDLTPLNEWQAKKAEERKKREEDRKKKEEEAKKWPTWLPKLWGQPVTFINGVPVRLSQAQESMEFHVVKTSESTADIGWSGTGWVAARAPGRSYVMTAGHVCESKDVYQIEAYDIDWEAGIIEFETIDLPITVKKHTMLNRDGVESANGSVVRDEDLDDDFNGNDLCMLGVGADLGPAIPVAIQDPEYGQTCSVVGAPTGLWGGGIAVASEAIFSGRGSVFGTEPDGLAFNGLLAPGNSGSAVVCDGHAVGVISLGSTRFKSLTHAVPHDSIRKFMRQALHLQK
jgi:hypothetical protein